MDIVHQIANKATLEFGSNQDRDELLRYLHWLYAVSPETLVEVGVESGGTSWATRHICSKAKLLLVDMNEPKMLPLIKAVPGETHFFQGRSEELAENIRSHYTPEKSVVFIDADHRYEAVLKDTQLYPAKYQVYHDIFWQPGNNAPQGGGADRFYDEHKDCCFIQIFHAGWAGIGVRMPKLCKTLPV